MKPFLSTLLSFCLLALFSNAQTWDIEWQYTSNKQNQDYFADIDQTSDGSFIVLGCESTNKSSDLCLSLYDERGVAIWSQTFGTAKNDIPCKVKSMENGDFLILGKTSDEGVAKTLLLKTDSNGNEIWRILLDSTKNEVGNDLIPLPDNEFLLAGSSGIDKNQMWLARFNEDGKIAWTKNFHPDIQGSITSVKILPNNELLMSARVQGTNKNDCDIALMRTDNLGNEVWFNHLSSPKIKEWPQCVCCSPDSSIIMVGWSGACLNDINSEYPVFDFDVVVKKFSANGKLIWTKSFDGEGSEGGNAVTVLPDGNFIIAGIKATSFSGKIGPWLLLLDSNGNIVNETLLNMRLEQAAKAIVAPDGGIVVIGPGINDRLSSRSDSWIIKFAGL